MARLVLLSLVHHLSHMQGVLPFIFTLLFCLHESKQHHTSEASARRFLEWMCEAPLCASCIYRYSLLYFLRSLTNALNESLTWGSSVYLGGIGYVAFCSFHKFQIRQYFWTDGLYEFLPFSALDNLSWIWNSNSSLHSWNKLSFP